MSLWNDGGNTRVLARIGVSILVFVDVALEPQRRAMGKRTCFRFNPCFRGCRSGTTIETPATGLLVVFQSLFSWMSLWNGQAHHDRVHERQVSILVFVDVALELEIENLVRSLYLSFQSLFSWMSLWNDDRPAGDKIKLHGFQSLFSWMSLWNHPGTGHSETDISQVSILVFVDVALELSGVAEVRAGTEEFQSLFSWMSLWNPGRGGDRVGKEEVSILVFVDVALERGATITGRW